MSDIDELKLCPFCGGYGVGPAFVCETGQWDIWQVECGRCGISIESPTGLNGDLAKRAAVTAWNTRPEEVTLLTEVSNLRRQVEGLIAAIEFEVPPIRDGVDVDSRLSILMECAKEARSSGGLSL